MKTTTIFLCLFSLSPGLVLDLPVQDLDYTIDKAQDYDRITVANQVFRNDPGSPEIPVIIYTYVIPSGQTITELETSDEQWADLPGIYYIYPEQKHYSMEKAQEFTQPDPQVYSSRLFLPASPIISYSCGNLRGYEILQIAVSPFRYIPASRQLSVLKSLSVRANTTAKADRIQPLRQSSASQRVFNRFVSAVSLNTPAAPASIIDDSAGEIIPNELPSLIGPPVDLVIVTTEPLAQEYSSFARLKGLQGYNTAVKTLTWIKQRYDGVDDAERIRNFLRDAVEKWGTSFALLAGDVPAIPTRWVWMAQVDPDQWPEHLITDLYFSDLDGTWNFDGDDRFGEPDDSVDFYPDIFVGRLTVTTPEAVTAYINKEISYLSPVYSGIQLKTLFTTSDMYVPNDGIEMAARLRNHLPSWLKVAYLNEQPLRATRDSIYSGYGIIQGIGHGDVNMFRVRNSPREYITNFSFDSLTNADMYALWIAITCYTNPFQSDCLGEHWVNNQHGGGIAYIGPSTTSEGYFHEDYTSFLYDSLFSFPLGAALAKSKIPFIPQCLYDNWLRLYQLSINLLGDPTLLVWDTIPRRFSSAVPLPETLNVGQDTLAILVTPAADSFTVVLYKENDLFMKGTGYNGSVQVGIRTKSAGYLKYSIVRKDYVTYIDSIVVLPSASYLVFNRLLIKDTLQNDNGLINPGEDIFLNVVLRNNGGLPATGVFARLISADSFITFINDTTTYPDIAAGGEAQNITPYYFRTSTALPDEHSLDFALSLDYSGLTGCIDSFQIIAYSPVLQLHTQHFTSINDTIRILPDAENNGHCLADTVIGLITALSDSVTIVDSIALFPDILPGQAAAALDSFKLCAVNPDSIKYNFRLLFRGNEVDNRNVRLQTPERPDSFRVLGAPNSIILQWKPVNGAAGYRIFRATSPAGPYQFLHNAFEPIAHFEDLNAQVGNVYYYYLCAVDLSMNEGAPSDTLRGTVSPQLHPGWPQTVYGYFYSSVNFADIDPYYPGLELIIGTRDDGTIYGWHCDGTPLNGTNSTNGRIFTAGAELWASPAIGDINNDGLMDIVFDVRTYTNNLYALTCYDTTWVCLPGWPVTVPTRTMTAAVLADLDKNGDLEIVIRTELADIYVFNHDGTGFYTPSGLLKDCPGNALGAPAVGDINNDGDLEIVACGGSWSESLFVWDRYGNYLPPFPVYIQSECRLRCAIALGDIIGDDRLEIAFFADSTNRVYLVSPDGYVLWSRDMTYLEIIESYPLFADITGDGKPELVCAESKYGLLSVFDSLGNPVQNFPLFSTEHEWRTAIAADLDNDDVCDIAVGANTWNLYGVNSLGNEPAGFPLELGNYIARSSPAAFDIDLDGKLELMVGACDFRFSVFDLNSTKWEWPKFRYDHYNTGAYRPTDITQAKEIASRLAANNAHLAVFPSLFRDKIKIRYMIHDPRSTTLKIYDISGRLIKNFSLSPSCFSLPTSVTWDGSDDLGRAVPAGVYFVRLEHGEYKKVKKVVLLR